MAIFAAIIGGIIAVGMPKTYRALATVIVPRQPQGIFLLGGGQAKSEEIALETQALIAQGNKTAIRTAKTLAERTVGRKIIVDPSEITAAVTAIPDPPDLIRIEARSEDQLKAWEFANTTANSFVDIISELRQQRAESAREYLDRQVETTRAELDELLANKQEYQRELGIALNTVTGPGGEQRISVSLGEPDFRAALREAQVELASTQARLAALEGQLQVASQEKPEKAVAFNPIYVSLQEQLYTARFALIQLKVRYTDDHPAVEELNTRLEELRAELEHTPELIETLAIPKPEQRGQLDQQRRATQRSVSELVARVASLQETVVAAEAKKSQILDKEGTLEQLQDQINLKRSAYQELLTQLEAKKLSVASEKGRASLVDEALTATATTPSLTKTLVFSLALGIFLGFALALLLEVLDDTIRRPEDLTRDADLRFLGIIPWTGEEIIELIMVDTPKSPPAEAFRTLRSNINFSTLDDPPKTILVTSAGAAEGKSMMCANLAVAFAQVGNSVLVLDTDLRRPTQHKLFGADPSVGLTNVLVGELSVEQAIQDTEVENLRILPSGPLPPNPAEMLDSARMNALLEELADEADLILLDSPPAIMLTDALVLASRVDQTLIVAGAGEVTRDAFDEMVRLIRHARGNILGTILNKLKLTASDYYYYYYYYYYYDYAPGEGRRQPGRGEKQLEPETAEVERPSDDELPF